MIEIGPNLQVVLAVLFVALLFVGIAWAAR